MCGGERAAYQSHQSVHVRYVRNTIRFNVSHLHLGSVYQNHRVDTNLKSYMEGSSFRYSRDRKVKDERVCRWGKSDILYLLNWEQMLKHWIFSRTSDPVTFEKVSIQQKFVFRLKNKQSLQTSPLQGMLL